ncbi:MAG: hypothetical protein SNF33_05145 [Candidatus Algichlamydia australiensis]|nr:hypothetical protein [Chlamydiales bacterium]
MHQINKVKTSGVNREPARNNKPNKNFKEVYNNAKKREEKKQAERKEDVFTISWDVSMIMDEEEKTLIIHGEGATSLDPTIKVLQDTLEVKIEQIQSQLDLIEERMAKAILLIKEEGGVESTTMILTPPNPCSLFNGVEIELTRFDTAPFAFNIEFVGNDAALQIFARHIGEFVDRFEQKHEGLLINRVARRYKIGKEKKQVRTRGVKDGNR